MLLVKVLDLIRNSQGRKYLIDNALLLESKNFLLVTLMLKTFFSLFSFCLMNYTEWGRGIAQLYYRKFSDFVIFKHNVLKSFLKNLYSSVFSPSSLPYLRHYNRG